MLLTRIPPIRGAPFYTWCPVFGAFDPSRQGRATLGEQAPRTRAVSCVDGTDAKRRRPLRFDVRRDDRQDRREPPGGLATRVRTDPDGAERQDARGRPQV